MALLIILLPIIAVANIIPQTGRVSPLEMAQWLSAHPTLAYLVKSAGFNHVYTSSWFLILTAVLFSNLTIITWQLAQRTWIKSKGLHRFTAQGPDYLTLATLPNATGLITAFEKGLRRKKYNLIKIGGELYGRKGWPGIWGGTLLHLGLVVILVGAICSGMSRFSGYLELGEGQEVIDSPKSYQQSDSGPLFGGDNHKNRLILKSISKEENGLLTVPLAVLTVKNRWTSVTETIRPNLPLDFQEMRIFLGQQSGPALLFSVIGPTGLDNGFVNLQPGQGGPIISQFTIAGTTMQAQVEYTEGIETINIEIREKEALIYQGPLSLRQSLRIQGYNLVFIDIRKWAGFLVVYDWAVPIVFAGFWMAVAGVLLMAVFDPREVWLQVRDQGSEQQIHILGWGRWKNMFQEEFKEVFAEVNDWQN